MKIVYTNTDGNITILYPTGNWEDAIKDVPKGIPYTLIEDNLIPNTRRWRNAWQLNNNAIEIDLTKAKKIREQEINDEIKLLKKEAFMEDDTKQQEIQTKINSKKNALKNLPDDLTLLDKHGATIDSNL